MRKHTFFSLIAVFIFVVSAIGTTQAAWKASQDSVHEIDLTGVKAQIVEEYERAVNVYPGNTVDKLVNVKNTGSSDCLVRVKVEKAWGAQRDEDGKLIVDDTYPTDNIIIDYNTDFWLYDDTDGYFYYKGVLGADEMTIAPLFEAFSISKETGNEYKKLEADILVKMECVQAAADGISIWEKSLIDLGIEYVTDNPNVTTSVTFVGGNDEFIFEPESRDLFANFKDLLPGETRSQTITVSNVFKAVPSVEIFLRAEDINQSFSDDPETLELVNKLLREHATIIITDDSGNVIYNGPVWGEPYSDKSNPDSMRFDISLGLFAQNETKNLNVQLQLDPDMDNEYQNLMGLIKWVWSANAVDAETVTINGYKIWNHGANPINNRPSEIIIYVKADGEVVTTTTITESEHWQWSFTLPKHDKFGNEITYTLDEEPISGYETVIDGDNVINTHETYEEIVVSGSKTWIHGNNNSAKPKSIIVHVKLGDEILETKRVTSADNWNWSFTLPKYDYSGKVAKYTIDEDRVTGYTLTKSDGYNLTNKFVSTTYPGDNPKTGAYNYVWLWGGVMMASGAVIIVLLLSDKKRKRGKAQ